MKNEVIELLREAQELKTEVTVVIVDGTEEEPECYTFPRLLMLETSDEKVIMSCDDAYVSITKVDNVKVWEEDVFTYIMFNYQGNKQAFVSFAK